MTRHLSALSLAVALALPGTASAIEIYASTPGAVWVPSPRVYVPPPTTVVVPSPRVYVYTPPRLLVNQIVKPSGDRLGWRSKAVELRAVTGVGAPQGADVVARVALKMSSVLVVRFETKKISS